MAIIMLWILSALFVFFGATALLSILKNNETNNGVMALAYVFIFLGGLGIITGIFA